MDWADEQARDHMGFRLDAPEDHLSEIDAEEVRALAALLREVRQQGHEEMRAKLAKVVEALSGLAEAVRRLQGIEIPCVWCHSQWPCEESSEEGR